MQAPALMLPRWVYSFEDYQQMFDLKKQDLKKRILDYPAGVSSFNAEMVSMGHQVTSGDEWYAEPESVLRQYVDQLMQADKKYLAEHLELLTEADRPHFDTLIKIWKLNAEMFLADYQQGLLQKRYQFMQLPTLPFEKDAFELTLCSDALFRSQASLQFSPDQLIEELLRISVEVRVYPLLNEDGEVSEALGPVMLHLQQQNYGVEVRQVEYEQLQGSNAMLRIWSRECTLAK